MDTYGIGSRSIANRAASEARSSSAPAESEHTFRGIILGESDGFYQIGATDENGVVTMIYEMVTSPSVLSTDTEVVVRVDAFGRAVVVSGGGGNCFQGVNEWGPLLG